MTTYDALVEQIADLYRNGDLHFGHGTQNAVDEAWWTVCSACDIEPDPEHWIGEAAVSESGQEATHRLARQRIESRQPLAYILNEAWFAGERYYVDSRVIVPRSHLGDWIPDQFSPWVKPEQVQRILDIGTGSGCIAIALARAFPEAAVVATDLSDAALEVARLNAERHEVSERITFLQADVYDNSEPPFDLIVSNPPYVNDDAMRDLPEEYRPEPEMAFRGGSDGLQIIHRIIAGAATDWLNTEGQLVMEIATARQAFERAYPQNTLMWLATSSDEEALMIANRDELNALRSMRRRTIA